MHRLLNKSPAPTTLPTVLALLRHGKTLWNEEGRIQGRQDSPLSPAGISQVQEWARFLCNYEIHHIIASDLGRVRETVALLQKQLDKVPIEWNPALREQSWGKWEGKTFTELKDTQEEELKAEILAGWNFRPPGGESRKEVLLRALPVIQQAVQQWPGKQILIVCHEGVIKSLIYHLAERDFLPDEKKLLDKRELHLLQGMDNRLSIGALNILQTKKKMREQRS
ncbi:MAG: histidine phosphatase family protein [Proteobacteria bacterium]|nr:histidine phosphatase family protein [Pseudomonadota bacterium]MBU1232571.1 histidine phosphatase family protein [Pseudomonadota bacterium]